MKVITKKSTNNGHNAFIEFPEFHDKYFRKRLLGTQWEEYSLKIIILAPMKLKKYLDQVLMINDIFSKMELMHKDIKTYKKW